MDPLVHNLILSLKFYMKGVCSGQQFIWWLLVFCISHAGLVYMYMRLHFVPCDITLCTRGQLHVLCDITLYTRAKMIVLLDITLCTRVLQLLLSDVTM